MKHLFLSLALLLGMAVSAHAAEDKTLVVATNPTWPPMELVDMNKQITGYDMDLMLAIAEEMGVKIKFMNTAWDGIFAGLDSRQCDIIASCVTITEERKKNYLFSEPYYEVRQALIVPLNSSITNFAGLEGKNVGVQIGTTAVEALRKHAKGINLKTYDEVGLVFEDLKNGRLDAAVCDDPVARYYAARKEGYQNLMKIVDLSQETETIGFVLRKQDTELQKQINDAIAKVRANGKEKAVAVKWLGE